MMLVMAGGSSSAQVIRMEDVLGTAQVDPLVSRYQSIRDLALDLKMHDPLIREISLRVGFNGSVLGDTIYGYLRNEDDIRLQVSFNAFGVRRQQKQVKSARLNTITAEQAVLSHAAIVERYEVLSAYAYALPELKALLRLDSLLQAEHEIIKAMLGTGILDIKVSRILDVEEDRNRVLLDITEAEDQLQLAKLEIEKYTGNFSALRLEQLASIEELKTSVAKMQASGYVTHPDHLALSAEVQLDSAALGYASGQNRQVLDYFSVGYQNPLYLERPNKFNTFNNFAFRLGLLVPITANNRYRKADAILDLQESQVKMEEASLSRDQAWQIQLAILDGLFKEYSLADERLENSLIRQMLNNQTLLSNISPLEIVELQIAQQKLVLQQLELAQDIAEAYVELLSLSGYLAWNPETNFLAKSSQ
jgi:hypothetical protein